MQYEGLIDQKRALIDALRVLSERGVSDQAIAHAIEKACLEGKIHGFPAKTKTRVSRATIQRYRENYDPETANMKYASAGLIYNYLRQSEALETSLRADPALTELSHDLSPLIGQFLQNFGAKDGHIKADSLNSLEGVFHTYRKAWSSMESRTYIRSVLKFEQYGSSLIYTNLQEFYDPAVDMNISDIETGFVIPFDMNVIMIGRGKNLELLRFTALHDFNPFPNGRDKIAEFGGTSIAVYNKGPHQGSSIIGKRVKPELASCKFYNEGELDQKIEDSLLEGLKKQAKALLTA